MYFLTEVFIEMTTFSAWLRFIVHFSWNRQTISKQWLPTSKKRATHSKFVLLLFLPEYLPENGTAGQQAYNWETKPGHWSVGLVLKGKQEFSIFQPHEVQLNVFLYLGTIVHSSTKTPIHTHFPAFSFCWEMFQSHLRSAVRERRRLREPAGLRALCGFSFVYSISLTWGSQSSPLNPNLFFPPRSLS